MKVMTANDNLETHGLLTKLARVFVVPLINHISPKLLRELMRGTSHDANTVVNNTGTTAALEAMYTRHHRSIFSRGVLQAIADLFWHHAISQPKALRNRLKIVEKKLDEEILKIAAERSGRGGPIKIVSVGGGSSRALIHSIHRLLQNGFNFELKITNIDKDKKATELGKELAVKFGLQNIFEWINDDARNLSSIVKKNSVDIVEMVGLLDYFSEEAGVALLNQVWDVLKNDGSFIVANVHPNNEMPFVDHLGWPPMYYRVPDELERILKKSGFSKEPVIIFEPLRVHIIADVRK